MASLRMRLLALAHAMEDDDVPGDQIARAAVLYAQTSERPEAIAVGSLRAQCRVHVPANHAEVIAAMLLTGHDEVAAQGVADLVFPPSGVPMALRDDDSAREVLAALNEFVLG